MIDDIDIEARLRAALNEKVPQLIEESRPIELPLVVTPSRVRRRYVGVAAAAVVIGAGLLMFALLSGRSSVGERDLVPVDSGLVSNVPEATLDPSTDDEASALSIPSTVPVSSTADVAVEGERLSGEDGVNGSEVGVPLVDEVTLATIGTRRAAALAELDGFAATHTFEFSPGPRPLPEDVQEITVLADGRAWAQDDRGGWKSVDPASGLYQAAYVDESGGTNYQEITDRMSFAFGGVGLAIGLDPVGPIDASDGDGVAIENTFHDGRAAWTVTKREENVDDDVQAETTWVIDIDTGLIVEYTFQKWHDDTEDHSRSTLTNLKAADELPAGFPGQFPQDAVVDSIDFSGGRRPVTLEEAASEFDPGLVVPADLPDDAPIAIYDRTIDSPGSQAHPDHEEVTIITRQGFNITTITVTKFIAHELGSLTIGDVQCHDLNNDDECDRAGVPGIIERGALAGREVRIGAGYVTVYDAGRSIQITNPDTEYALQLAGTFVSV